MRGRVRVEVQQEVAGSNTVGRLSALIDSDRIEGLTESISSSTPRYARSVSRSSRAILHLLSSRRIVSSSVPPAVLLVRTRSRFPSPPNRCPIISSRSSSSRKIEFPILVGRLSGLRGPKVDFGMTNGRYVAPCGIGAGRVVLEIGIRRTLPLAGVVAR